MPFAASSRTSGRRAAVLMALVALLVSGVPVAGRASGTVAAHPTPAARDAAPRGAGGTVKGDCVASDCLELDVNADGSIGGVDEGARALPMNGKKGGFSVRMVGNQPNLLVNPGFESASGGWTFPTSGTYKPVRVADGDAGHAGGFAAKVAISGTVPKTSAYATQTVTVSPNTNYVITGWFKTTAIGPNSTETTAPLTYKADLAPVAIRIEMMSGSTVLRTNWNYGYTGTATWHENAVGVKTISTANRLRIGVGVRGGYGTVLFDDLKLSRLLAPTGTPLPVTATQPGGGNNPVVIAGTVTGQPLDLDATITPTSKGIEIAGTVTNTSAGSGSLATDRALQLSYTIPINATGWAWGDTPRVSRTIASTGSYFFENNLNSPTARYPWATVFDSSSGLSIGSPLTKPRAYALRYSAKGLTITFDLGTSRSATELGGTASFKIQLFRSDESYRLGAAWGFRGAIAKFYELNPASFARKAQITPDREGIPFYQPPIPPTPGGVTDANATKLHLGLNVLTLNNLKAGEYPVWDEASGRAIYSAVYSHHWGHFQPCAPDCATTTYNQVRNQVTSDSTMTCGTGETLPEINCRAQKAEAIAALQSTALDMNGRFRYDVSDNDQDFRIRQIPGLDLGTNPEWFEAVRDHQLVKADEYSDDAGATLDAVYVDSTSGMRAVWGDVDDYGRSHWAALPEPAALSFSYHSGRVVLQSFFANYIQLRKVRTWAEAQTPPIFLVLDTNGKEQTPGGILATDMADWLLMENSLRDLESPPPGVTPDSFGLLKRVLADQRPVTSVDPKLANSAFPFGPTTETSGTSLATDSVVARVNESLFYGIWPGPDKWNYNTVSPAWYTATKYVDLYDKYGKLLRNLAESGWEPITLARSSNANVWVERYGSLDATHDDLFIALRNNTAAAITSTITVKFGKAAPLTTADEKVRNRTLTGYTLNGANTQATFSVSVPAGTTLLVKFNDPAQ